VKSDETMRGRSIAATVAAGLITLTGCTSSGSGSGPGLSGTPTPTTRPAQSASTTVSSSATGAASNGTSASSSATDSAAGPPGSALVAYQRWVQQWNTRHFTDMHRTLAVEQQQIAEPERFNVCSRDALLQGGFTSISYRDTVAQKAIDVTLPGTTRRVHGTAITADLALDGHDPQERTVTTVWFTDGATWRWALDSRAVRSYRKGACPQ
jgi:hypothetical protein